MFKVAQVLKSNGTDGELVIGFRNVAPEDIQAMEPVFLYFEGLPVPFFIEALRRRGTDKALVRLNDIHSLEDAEELVGKDIFVREECLDEDERQEGFGDLTGWTLQDPSGQVLGTVSGVEDIPGNPCLYVSTGRQEVLVPLHEHFVVGADPTRKILTMDLPDGLFPTQA